MNDLVPEVRRFKHAPVIETVLSIQFAPIPGFSIAHFGLYWSHIRNEFPRTEIKPPILHLVEDLSKEGPIQNVPSFLNWPTEQMIRCWFLDERGSSFVQLQPDRLLYNWQQIETVDVYPRYAKVRSNFLTEWLRFCSFLEKERLEQPRVDQCEVTYVNHILYGAGWNSFGELDKVVSLWSGQSSGDFLRAPEKVSVNVQYIMPEGRGRLYVSLQPVIRKKDAKEVLQLNLTARGAPLSSQTDDVFRWLDLGREWVVKGFTDFTTPEMHRLWGREL